MPSGGCTRHLAPVAQKVPSLLSNILIPDPTGSDGACDSEMNAKLSFAESGNQPLRGPDSANWYRDQARLRRKPSRKLMPPSKAVNALGSGTCKTATSLPPLANEFVAAFAS
jgi:hypothetical protein